MYNLKDRTLEVKFRGNENSCSQIHASFSDDGKYVICGSEDRKVYIWPTAVDERPDSDKHPMEVFEAHSAIVTTAILAPEKTRRLLAQSGDPLYDLCNPPPVTLVSRADSVISSRAPTHHSNQSDEKQAESRVRTSESPKRAPETPAYLARHSHIGGQIIVTADYTGQIKVFRQDCAYQKRKAETWDTGSTFSKKVLGRSGSVATRNSITSSNHRTSLVLGSKNQSTDRILNWRNSIQSTTTLTTASSASIREVGKTLNNERSRSTSPKKVFSKRLSMRRASSTDKNGRGDASSLHPNSPLQQIANGPTISIQSPLGESPGSFHSAAPLEGTDRTKEPHAAGTSQGQGNPVLALPQTDTLHLIGDQSYMAWDTANVASMARHAPRTPGLLGVDENPLSRAASYISQLSSEMTGSERDPDSANASQNGGEDDRNALRTRISDKKRRTSSVGSTNDLKCTKCGGRTFKATMVRGKQTFRCKKCGTDV